jgi:glycosyltransferase involved in cell wall biosynthesis
MNKRKKIVHIIVGLNNGGAEMMLYKLLKYIDKEKYECSVISMMDKGVMKERIEKLGIPVYCLNMKRGVPSIQAIVKSLRLCKDKDIIQTWMYHANLLGCLVGKILNKKIIWGIHHSNLEKDKNKKSTLIIAKINSYLSKWIDNIVSCSNTAKEIHIKYGYKKEKIVVIPNGFEIEEFNYLDKARNILEKEFLVLKDKIIFSLVARYDILKDHKTCIEAMKIIKERYNKNFILLLCGTNINKNNQELVRMIEENKLEENILLLDRRDDIPIIMSATDIYISSSSGEGFPNVIGEAMACETPCVVTDVGDSAYIVGNTGKIVDRCNPKQLAEAIIELLTEVNKDFKSKECRKRIEENFEINNIVKRYEKIYNKILDKKED